MSDLVLFSVFAVKNSPWRLPCTGKRCYLLVKGCEVYGIKWGGKSYSLFSNLWKSTVPHLLSFPSLAELNHLSLFVPYGIHSKIVPSIPVFFFLFTFFCMESAGLLLTVLCWQRSQERLWVADSCWNKSLPLWGEKEIHSTFPVSLFPSTLTSFFLLHSFHNNSLVHWMQTGGMFFHI